MRSSLARLPFFYGWVIVAIAFVTMAIGVNARTAFSLFFPPIVTEFGWDRGATAGAFSFGFLITAFASPLFGRLMDRYGPLVIIEGGIACVAAGLFLAAHMREPWHLYLTLGVLVGLGSTCLGYTGQGLYLPNWFARRRGLATSIAYAGAGVGSIFMMPWLQSMIVAQGWRAAATAAGLLVLVVLAPLNLLVRRRPEDLGLRPDGDGAPAGSAGAAPSNVVDHAWAAIDWTLARALRTARFWWLASAMFAAMFSWYTVQVHQTKYLIEVGHAPMYAAWALGFVSLIAVPGQILMGHLSDRFGREWVWAAGNAGFALTYVLLIVMRDMPGTTLLWAMVFVQGFIGYGLTGAMGAAVSEIFQGRHFGSIFGMLMGIGMAGGALGPWLAGVIHDATGSYSPVFALAIACSVASAACLAIAAPRKVRLVAGRVGRA
ncbi:MAG: MFS transporter [Burkholderiales bacterium]|nr:MFS transporter [Burkholderiales bacterium]